MYYAMRKSKPFLNWPSGQDLLAVLKSTPLLPHAKMLLVPICFFFWRVDYALECSVLSEQIERANVMVMVMVMTPLLIFMICPLMQERFL